MRRDGEVSFDWTGSQFFPELRFANAVVDVEATSLAVKTSFPRYSRPLGLSANRVNKMIAAGEKRHHDRGRTPAESVCNDALEFDSVVRKLGRHKGKRAPSAGGALRGLLAADLRIYLPTWLFHLRRPGFNSGFFPHGT